MAIKTRFEELHVAIEWLGLNNMLDARSVVTKDRVQILVLKQDCRNSPCPFPRAAYPVFHPHLQTEKR